MSAAWATRLRILSGVGLGIAGSASQAVVWASIYVVLARLYRGPLVEYRVHSHDPLRRIGCALVLAFVSAAIVKWLMQPMLAPLTWNEFRYLRQLLAPVFVGLWCLALLPRETRHLFRTAETNRKITPFPQLTLLLASAAVLVSCGDLAFQFSSWSGGDTVLRTSIISPEAWATNTVILFSAFALVFAISARIAIAVLVVAPIYAAWATVNLVKIHYMHLPVQPLDVILIPELLPLLPRFFGKPLLAGTSVALVTWVCVLILTARFSACRITRRRRAVMGLLSLAVLVAFPAAFFAAPSSVATRTALRFVGAPTGHRDQSRQHGLLLTFLSDLPHARITVPGGYTAETVKHTLNKYSRPAAEGVQERDDAVNVIVYLVESFMDPGDLGLRFTSDPIPNLRALRATQGARAAIVPGQFGGSANTEFEVLTGMTMALLPPGSVPFKRYLWRPIPSLVRALRDVGYMTVAIQADPKYYFNRERAYNLLGFDHVIWLDEDGQAERDARGTGLVSDAAVVQALIGVSRERRPLFAFAFPTSTHAPYNSRAYRNSDLDVADDAAHESRTEIKDYINAVRVADQAIGTLIRHFRDRPGRTIIVILGDHLPPLSQNALQGFYARSSRLSDGEKALMTRRVPLLIWSNFEIATPEGEMSTSVLPSYLLETMNIVPTRLLALTAALRRSIPVIGPFSRGTEGEIWKLDEMPAAHRAMVEDYDLLQYDLLFGKQYSLCDTGTDCLDR